MTDLFQRSVSFYAKISLQDGILVYLLRMTRSQLQKKTKFINSNQLQTLVCSLYSHVAATDATDEVMLEIL